MATSFLLLSEMKKEVVMTNLAIYGMSELPLEVESFNDSLSTADAT
jgi:hypothetical protein